MENPYTIKQVLTDSNLLQAWYKVREDRRKKEVKR